MPVGLDGQRDPQLKLLGGKVAEFCNSAPEGDVSCMAQGGADWF